MSIRSLEIPTGLLPHEGTATSNVNADPVIPAYSNTNGMPFVGDKNLHMEVGPDDIAARIVTVGATSRLRKMVAFFDKETPVKEVVSGRGFTTATGKINGVDLSIVSIGMGYPMMDFFVRESRAVIDGPMAIVRFGTCGGISSASPPGSIVVASEGSGMITRNFDTFSHSYEKESKKRNFDSFSSAPSPYHVHKIAPADDLLSAFIREELVSALGATTVLGGVNVTADSFYSSQGRIDPNFGDVNDSIIDDLQRHYPRARTLEMETFQLLHLARCSKDPIHASAAAIVVANRSSAVVASEEVLNRMELESGHAIMRAVARFPL